MNKIKKKQEKEKQVREREIFHYPKRNKWANSPLNAERERWKKRGKAKGCRGNARVAHAWPPPLY